VLGMVSLIVLDVLWIQGLAANLYKNTFPLTITFNLGPALLVYFLLALGIRYFVIGRDLSKVHVGGIIERGALLGLVTYGVYNLTNMATLKEWTILFGTVDILWGTLAVALGSVFVYLIVPWFE
jgi:uncharacterized membrane protein